MTLGGREAEVNIFVDELQESVAIDFEFATAEEKAAFVAPSDLVLADITQEDFITVGLLTGKTYDNITPKLARFNYQKL